MLAFTVSCQDNDPAAGKGSLQTATYSATNKTFTLQYESGYSHTVNAQIDHTTTPPRASATLEDGTIVSVTDATISGDASIETPDMVSNNKYVNGWIYDEMGIYYLWNDKITKSPNYSLNPVDFFDSMLYKYHPTSNPDGDRFSWIQENYVDLKNSLNGVSSDEIGFEYIFVGVSENQYYALVLYPRKGTDAEAKGIKRGRFITKVNGQNITPANYQNVLKGSGTKSLSMADWTIDSSIGPDDDRYPSYELVNTGEVTVQMHNKYAEIPVYLDSVYSINNQKVGYLVYNFFARDKDDNSYDYDKLLMNRLNAMKAQGVNEMVLDLRYNSGGAVSSAIALASALVKDRSTSNVLTTSEYNSIVHNSLLREYGVNYNKEYFISQIDTAKIVNQDVIDWIKITDVPALNLPRLYVLTSGWTASASEFVINGLNPYMEVILIGETTYGKNVGSISIYEENDPKNKWGMQPIIVRYANSEGFSAFTAGFTPKYEIDEFNPDGIPYTNDELFLFELGDINDPLLGKAISLISDETRATRSIRTTTPFRSSQIDRKETIRTQDRHRFDMEDDVRGDDIRKLMKKY